MEFKLFEKELLTHGHNGYHRIVKENLSHIASFQEKVTDEYMQFLQKIGSGIFYNGSLQIFSVNDNDFMEFNEQLQKRNENSYLAIGYNGTTEGCYCLKKDLNDNGVYWFYWNEIIPQKISDSFYSWIERTPQQLFSEKVYKGFKNIKDFSSINSVLAERKKINIKLLSFDKDLIAQPNETKQYLKRYNKIYLEITKKENTFLENFTIKLFRAGSTIGYDNIEYITLDIQNIPVLKPTNKEVFLFDPFNLHFENIICFCTPEIDLSSPMRVKYKEIKNFL